MLDDSSAHALQVELASSLPMAIMMPDGKAAARAPENAASVCTGTLPYHAHPMQQRVRPEHIVASMRERALSMRADDGELLAQSPDE